MTKVTAEAELARLGRGIAAANAKLDKQYAQRTRLFMRLRARKPPMSWARIGALAGCSEQAVIQAVNTYLRKKATT